MKRKSPKALRKTQNKWGILTLGNITDIRIGHSLYYNQQTTVTTATSFSFDYDTGIQKGDYIIISGSGVTVPPRDHKKVHVARRRATIKSNKKQNTFIVTGGSSTTLTVESAA